VHAIVCGGAGFIGSHLVDRLLREDGVRVTVIDDLSTGRPENLTDALATGRVDVRRLSITDPALGDVVAEVRPELIFNLAAQINVRDSVADPVFDASINIIGTVSLLEAARRAGVRKVVQASSVAIYGPPDVLPVTEATPTRPLSPYATSKLAAEIYLRQFQDLHGLATTTLVLTNTYGPRQYPGGETGAIAIFADAMLNGRPTHVFGDGSNTRDYLYVDDAVDAFVRAAGAAGSGLRLNVATGVETTDLELHRAVAAAVGGAAEPSFAPPRLGDLPHMVVDSSAATRELGWRAQVGLKEGLVRTVESLRA
jgi:UDP-glucose 4-epimerase